jgi:hypothetical protein
MHEFAHSNARQRKIDISNQEMLYLHVVSAHKHTILARLNKFVLSKVSPITFLLTAVG